MMSNENEPTILGRATPLHGAPFDEALPPVDAVFLTAPAVHAKGLAEELAEAKARVLELEAGPIDT